MQSTGQTCHGPCRNDQSVEIPEGSRKKKACTIVVVARAQSITDDIKNTTTVL